MSAQTRNSRELLTDEVIEQTLDREEIFSPEEDLIWIQGFLAAFR